LAASNLVVRLATAAIGAAVVVPLVFVVPAPGFFLLVAFATAACAWELCAMASPDHLLARAVAALGAGVVCAEIYFPTDRPLVLPLTIVAIVVVQGALHLARAQPIETAARRFGAAALSTSYAACTLPFVALFHRPPLGARWVLLVLVATWFADSGAYFTGRAIGKTKLAPKISPGKTVEGAVGGLVAAIGGSILVRTLLLPGQLPLVDAAVVGILGGILGPLGDLVESLLKRSFGAKDSGKLLPGHGGMLDRVDALLFVAPAAWAWLSIRGVI